jgi:hypothetical protein
MASANVEQRLSALEQEVAELKRQLAARPSPTDRWWERISGAFARDDAFQEAMRLGRQWRERENARSLRKAKRKTRGNKDVRS